MGSRDDGNRIAPRAGLFLVMDSEQPYEDRRDDAGPQPAPGPTGGTPVEVLMERVHAAQDRAAATRARRAAARDLERAADYLRAAHRDELTGALQRWPGMVELSRLVNCAHLEGSNLVVAFADVDGLKRVNDTNGHAAGDDLLRAVGQALTHALRTGDVVLRYGGDEFVCALRDAELPDVDARIRQVSTSLSEVLPQATVSVGLVQLQPDEQPEAVVRRADEAMYLARSRARGDRGRSQRD